MVGILRSLTARKLLAAVSESIFCFQTAFQRAFATSSQNRSGTKNGPAPVQKDASNFPASETSDSSRAGKHHLTATLASTTVGVIGRGPHGSFLLPMEMDPR